MALGRTVRFGFCYMLLILGIAKQSAADGLPGEYLLTQRWRGMIAQHSPFTNPALMTEENYVSVRAALAPILQGSFLLGEVGTVIPIGLFQSVGLSCMGEFDGDITPGIHDSSTSSSIINTNRSSMSNNNISVGISYAWHFWNKLSAGANVKLVSQSNFGDPKRGFGLDLGLTYRLCHSAFFGDHVVGASLINLVPPSMGNTATIYKAGAYSRNLKLTWLGNYLEHRFESAIYLDLKDILAAADVFRMDDGVEVANKIEWDVNMQMSARLLRIIKVSLQAGINEDAFDYFGFAVGATLPSLNNSRDMDFDYQYDIMTEAGNEATSHTFNLRMDFGKHREEVYARKMARMASISPNELYNKARSFYAEGKFWEAFFVFTRILVEFPDFFKMDWVEYFRASCKEEMDMREMAVKNYGEAKKAFPHSEVVPQIDLGLMRVFYRNGEFGKVAQQFKELNKPNVQDSLRFHATYLQGQVFLQSNETGKAIQAFSIIPDLHPDYVYAQHAIAVSKARMGNEPAEVVPHLENCLSFIAVTEGQKEIVNRSYLFLGYIFYEENALSNAVVSLRMVPATSYFAEDALLGQGWTALKARQWNDCVLIGQQLSKITTKSVLQCEGMLIEGYGYLLQKNYYKALAILKRAFELTRTLKDVDKDSLDLVKMQYKDNRAAHNNFADNVDNYAKFTLATSNAQRMDSLFMEQTNALKKFDVYYTYTEDFERTSFFSRNVSMMKNDIEYALAIAEKLTGKSNLIKEHEKFGEEQEEIDKEIEQLKREMEKIQNK